MPNKPEPSLKGRALRLLAMRDHSRVELERKLAPHTEDPDALRRALDELQAKGFIDEARAARSLLHRRAPKLGAARVKAELQQRGLPDAVVAETMAELRGTEAERAHEVWRRKFGEPPADLAERARQMRFLAARGFAPELIRRTVPAIGGQHTWDG